MSTEPPTGEFEFKSIWKLYFVLIITQKLTEYSVKNPNLKIVQDKRQESDLMPRRTNFSSILKMVQDYIVRLNPQAEPSVYFNQHTGLIESMGVKISLLEPSSKESDKGIVSVDHLLECINEALKNTEMDMPHRAS